MRFKTLEKDTWKIRQADLMKIIFQGYGQMFWGISVVLNVR